MLLRLGLDILSLPRDGLKHSGQLRDCCPAEWNPHLEACFDGLDRAGAVAGHALEEEETTLLGQDGVGGSGQEYYLLSSRV